MKVWDYPKKLWKHSPAARVPTAFLVLPNFHSCLYVSIETRYMLHGTCFLFLNCINRRIVSFYAYPVRDTLNHLLNHIGGCMVHSKSIIFMILEDVTSVTSCSCIFGKLARYCWFCPVNFLKDNSFHLAKSSYPNFRRDTISE